jgi:hypothetical protein
MITISARERAMERYEIFVRLQSGTSVCVGSVRDLEVAKEEAKKIASERNVPCFVFDFHQSARVFNTEIEA